MKFLADLHIHSKYSMATGKNLDLENNYVYALKKGINILGTGDFTHPAWFNEIESKLESDGSGLFSLKKDIIKNIYIEDFYKLKSMKFMLQCEISSIYKKNGKVRKIHNLLFFPSIESVRKFNSKLDIIGNIKSDGRPILGLDSRNLLEIALETDEDAFLVPAHIWTPWFSLFGSKSGFDRIEECFEDLSSEIFALETGLSSDPEMNWMISDLDRFTLISNSDAHSPSKIGREANIFDCEMSFEAIKNALKYKDNNKFKGTFEFFPEEGKYHYDGHRKCNICISPEESLKMNGICPVCGKKLTLGVLYRVSELADRKDISEIKKVSPEYKSIVPLTNILSEILRVGPNTKKVLSAYDKVISVTGSEFDALWWSEYDLLEKAGIPLLPEALKRMRKGEILIDPGYDGEFGKIKLFDDKDINNFSFSGQKVFFDDIQTYKIKKIDKKKPVKISDKFFNKNKNIKKEVNIFKEKKLNSEQIKAVSSDKKNIIIIAGPGTGKTFTLTSKLMDIAQKNICDLSKVLCITFTVKAAEEMKSRIVEKKFKTIPFTGTFHKFAISNLKEQGCNFEIIDEETKKIFMKFSIKESGLKYSYDKALSELSFLKQKNDFFEKINKNERSFFKIYEDLKNFHNLKDFDDILLSFLELLKTDISFKKSIQNKYLYILVDEYQDLNEIQYEILKNTKGENTNIFAIGDPDQSIYNFRGGKFDFFKNFKKDFKNIEVFNLERNYRSTETIINCSFQIINSGINKEKRKKIYSGIKGYEQINIIQLNDSFNQAKYISDEIQNLVGGTGHHITYRKDFNDNPLYSFSDLAVLCRTKKETDIISEIFEKNSIPHNKTNHKSLIEEKPFRKLFSYMKILKKEPDISDYFISPFGFKTELENIKTKDFLSNEILNKTVFLRKLMKNKKISEIIDYFFKEIYIENNNDDYKFINKKKYLKEISNNYNEIDDFLTDMKLKILHSRNFVTRLSRKTK